MSSPKEWYDIVCKYYLITPALFFPPYFFVDAPFGRFSPAKASWMLVDGIKSWMAMEIVSPVCFILSFLSSPLTRPISSLKRFPLSPPLVFTHASVGSFRVPVPNAPTILSLLFLGHYLNRAIISPLRTPARSKSHIAVPLFAIFFNTINGSLMGAFFAALAAAASKSSAEAWRFRGYGAVNANWTFWVGVTLWAVGFASNIWHDEILLNIRRSQRSSGGDKGEKTPAKTAKPHYAIPYGGLYSLISYPNYFSEWAEWLGFAIATTALTAQLPSTHAVFPFTAGRLGLGALSSVTFIQHLTPPWLFFLSEVFLMFPRAWNGHEWYHKTFPDYPRERKAVIPFLL